MLHGRGKSIAPSSREAINVQLAVLPTNNSINGPSNQCCSYTKFVYFEVYPIAMQWYMIRNDRFSARNDFKECAWYLRLGPIVELVWSWRDSWDDFAVWQSTVEMEKRDLWPGLIRRCSWKCHSCTAKDSLIIIKTHMVTAVHSVSLDLILINYKLTELILYQKSRNFGAYFF